MEKQQKINNTFGFRERERIANAEKVNDLEKEYYGLTKEALSPEQTARLEAMVAAQSELVLGTQLLAQAYTELDRELIQLNDSGYQVVQAAEAIGSAFSESFKGVIKGTMSVQEAFANMFQRIADHFLDMAAQIAASQLQKGILGMFTKMLPGQKVSSVSDLATGDSQDQFLFNVLQGATGYANGGRPPKGRPSIVGERGPELFVPDAAGTIIPNHAMGGANVVVNVDASGSSVEGDDGAAQELGSMLAAAIQSELVKEKRPGGLLA